MIYSMFMLKKHVRNEDLEVVLDFLGLDIWPDISDPVYPVRIVSN